MPPAPSPSAQVDGSPAAGRLLPARVGGIAGSATMAVVASAEALRAELLSETTPQEPR